LPPRGANSAWQHAFAGSPHSPLIPQALLRYTAPKFELSRFEAILRVFMASMAEGQLAFEGTASDFQSLEEKIYRTIELLKAARAQKAAAELELVTMREMLDSQAAETEALRKQLEGLQQERNEVRSRVEKLLGEVDLILEP
jgi:chromosome segregation ATPase